MSHRHSMGDIIRRWRVAKRLSKRVLAERIGRSVGAIHYIERNDKGMHLSTAVRLCRALGRTVDELVKEARI